MNGSVTAAPHAPAETGKYSERRAMDAPPRAGNGEIGTPPAVPPEEEAARVAAPVAPPSATPPMAGPDAPVARGAVEATPPEVEALSCRVDRVETVVVDLRADGAGLRTEVDGLHTEVDGLHTEVDRVETKVDRLETKVDGLRIEIAKIGAALTALPAEVAAQRQALDTMMILLLSFGLFGTVLTVFVAIAVAIVLRS